MLGTCHESTSTLAVNVTATTTGPRYRNTTTSFNMTTTAPNTTFTAAPTVNITSLTLTSIFTRIATQSSTPTLTIPGMTLTSVAAQNLTHAYHAVATAMPSCYHLPTASDGLNHGVMLHNEELRDRNATIPSPYVEAYYSDADSVQPLMLALRKNSTRHFLDISKPNQIGLVDSTGNSLHLDENGLHFATNACEFAYSVTAEGLYQQLRQLSGIACAAGAQFKAKQIQTISQVLFLQDQCGRSVDSSIRLYSQLLLGGVPCNAVDVDGDAGKWTFSCLVSNTTSAVAKKCESSVQTALAYILDDPFGGACPSLPDVVATLGTFGEDLLNRTVMEEALLSVNSSDSSHINQTVATYQQLWSGLRAVFAGTPSALSQYIAVYNKFRDFSKDICADLHPSPNNNITMSLRAGASYDPALLTFTSLPAAPLQPLNVTITDPSNMACCSAGYESSIGGENNKTCTYPAEAFDAFPGCVCGKTTEESPVAYKVRQCHDYDVTCSSSVDCLQPGGDDRVCVKGSCCGRGICIDPFECSQGRF